jgi:AbrB family looped-hinge helix DNA binding protein
MVRMTSYEVKISSKGQLTLPMELRREWNLKDGETVEFFRSQDGQVSVIPRNLPASAIFGMLAHLQRDPAYESDDDAIMDQVVADDEATKSGRAKSRAA